MTLLLIVLTRDGNVHRLDDHNDVVAAAHATAVAAAGKHVVTLAAGKLAVDGKPLPLKPPADAPGDACGPPVALAAGDRDAILFYRTAKCVVQVDLATGKRATVLEMPRAHRIAADGASVFAEAFGTVMQVGTDRHWAITGRPIALAAGDGKLYVATKEGPLWEVDRATGAQRNLGLGDWWGTLALAYGDHALYAVTVAGKLWRIDPQRREKTIVSMEGWQGAIDLAVLR